MFNWKKQKKNKQMSIRPRMKGFTLLETLVAMAILAISLAAVMRATGAGINNAEAMRMRVLADWVAQNRLAQHAAQCDFFAPGIQNGEENNALALGTRYCGSFERYTSLMHLSDSVADLPY